MLLSIALQELDQHAICRATYFLKWNSFHMIHYYLSVHYLLGQRKSIAVAPKTFSKFGFRYIFDIDVKQSEILKNYVWNLNRFYFDIFRQNISVYDFNFSLSIANNDMGEFHFMHFIGIGTIDLPFGRQHEFIHIENTKFTANIHETL